VKIVNLAQMTANEVDMEGARDVYKQVPIGQNDGSPTFSVRVFTIEPNGHTPYHRHPFEHLNYVIEGHGALVDEGGGEQKLEKGDFVLVLPDEKHQYRNRSKDERLVMICAVPREYE
jgi:quercetin dioxygenase-like cupin family protein